MKKKALKLNLTTIRNLEETDLALISGSGCPGGPDPCPDPPPSPSHVVKSVSVK